MFNNKTNSIKKLWNNLNTVCSFKRRTARHSVEQILSGDRKITTPQEICHEFNNYFSDTGNVLLNKLHKTHPN